MTLDLGVDAGGSKAAWIARDPAGVERARGVAGSIQAAAAGPEVVAAMLAELVSAAEASAGAGIASLVAGIAGAGSVPVRRALRDACAARLRPQIRVGIVGDVEVAAATCLAEASGLAIWSGTGSFCVARAADGALHRVGGRGLVLDDRGGAAAIVLGAARMALESDDGVRGPTALRTALASSFGVPRARELGRAMRDLAPGELARRLPEVAACADAGDRLAREVFVDEATRLAARAAAAAERAALDRAACPLFFGGGALEHCAALRGALCDALHDLGFRSEPHAARAAVEGAVALARAQRDGRGPLDLWLMDDHAA